MGRRGDQQLTTPLRHIVPSRSADAQMWVRHAIAGKASGEGRVRFTRDDNAPQGREVHWASPLLWILRSASGTADIEQVVRWLNVPLFLTLVIVLSAWAGCWAGAGAGVLVALGMLGHNRFYGAFAPANLDHHGLINACALGAVLGLVFMGAGWWKPNLGGAFTTLLPSDASRARRAAIASAMCGATGLWISAASVGPSRHRPRRRGGARRCHLAGRGGAARRRAVRA
jgi:hypothetical protein